jgi:Ca-activated chloride channel homolog
MVTPLLVALACLLVAAVGEWLHARRIERVARLAFGAEGRPAAWTRLSPAARCLGVMLASWGAAVLMAWNPVEFEATPNPKASKQLLICLDVSPSMQIEDAGPETTKLSRARWAGRVTQAVLDRLDMKDTRITLVAFYSKALCVLKETTDKNVVSNMLDGLPMYVGFQPGETDLAAGLRESLSIARGWARKSATLVVISDGDVEKGAASLGALSLPVSIADAIVIGVGDPNRPTILSGHSSRQDAWSLKQIAAKINGIYHEGNRLHLPTAVLDRLTMMSPRAGSLLSLREAAMIAMGVGASLVAFTGPLLLLAGTPTAHVASRERLRRSTTEVSA